MFGLFGSKKKQEISAREQVEETLNRLVRLLENVVPAGGARAGMSAEDFFERMEAIGIDESRNIRNLVISNDNWNTFQIVFNINFIPFMRKAMGLLISKVKFDNPNEVLRSAKVDTKAVLRSFLDGYDRQNIWSVPGIAENLLSPRQLNMLRQVRSYAEAYMVSRETAKVLLNYGLRDTGEYKQCLGNAKHVMNYFNSIPRNELDKITDFIADDFAGDAFGFGILHDMVSRNTNDLSDMYIAIELYFITTNMLEIWMKDKKGYSPRGTSAHNQLNVFRKAILHVDLENNSSAGKAFSDLADELMKDVM